jgi:hypothetical protein
MALKGEPVQGGRAVWPKFPCTKLADIVIVYTWRRV